MDEGFVLSLAVFIFLDKVDKTGDFDTLLSVDAPGRLEQLYHVLLGNIIALLLESTSDFSSCGLLQLQELEQGLLYRALHDLLNLDYHRVRMQASKLLILASLFRGAGAAFGGR